MPITDLLQKAENSGISEQVKWEWTRGADLAFWSLKRAFTDAPILKHCGIGEPIIL